MLLAGTALGAGPALAGVNPGGPMSAGVNPGGPMVGGPGTATFTTIGPTPGGPTPGPSPVAPPPDIPVIQLGPTFSPSTLSLGVGQQFVVTVSQDVQPTWDGVPDGCTPGQSAQVANGALALQCTAGGGYMFTAEQAGQVTLAATVRPSCAPGTACPQWITETSLQITIS